MKYNKKIVNRLRHIVLIIILCFLFSLVSLYRNAAAENDVIKVGCFSLNGYCNIAKDGSLSGYGVEYLNSICNIAELNVKYIMYNSWSKALDGLSRGDIDVLGPAQRTSEREKEFDFTAFSAGIEYGAILAPDTSDNFVYEDFHSFQGLKIGCAKDLVFLDSFKKYEKRNNFNVSLVYYKDTNELLKALANHEVDAIVANIMVKTDSMKTLARFGAAPYYFMVSKEKNGLVEKLNDAVEKQNSQNPGLQNYLQKKYFESINHIPFTKKEINYIEGSEKLKVAFQSHHNPFSYINSENGLLEGVDKAILDKLSEISGLKFECVAIPDGEDAVRFLSKNNIQLLAGFEINNTNVNVEGLSITNHIYDISKSFIGPENTEFSISNNMSVATVKMTNGQLDFWKHRYPAFSFHEYQTEEDCVKAIWNGESDIILSNRYTIENILDKPQNSDLSILTTVATNAQICIGINNQVVSDKILLNIINKSISQITNEDIETYLSEYAHTTYYKYRFSDFVYVYHRQIIILIIIIVIFIVAVALFFKNRKSIQKEISSNLTKQLVLTEKLRIENKRTELILEKVDEVFFEVISTNGHVMVSPSFYEKFGWTCPKKINIKENAIKQLLRIVPDDIEVASEMADVLISNKEPVNFTVRLERCTEADNIWCEISCFPIMSDNGRMVSIIGLIKDVNNMVLEREKLLKRSERDSMTDLLNKEAFKLQVKKALNRQPDGNHAILFVDLDYFKSVNDILGHLTGDKAICEAADKLKLIFSNHDIISRFGGDEFCVFVKDIPITTLKSKLDWMIEKLQADYSGTEGMVHVSCSCGVACTDVVGYKYKNLILCADKALYISKKNGRNKYTFYS